MTADRVDRDSMVPLFQQVMRLITARIDSGKWPPGSRLPAEPELAEALGVNRGTLRHGIQELVAAGRLRIVRGRGTYVLGDGQRPE
jgi:GntR family transcriptional regulator